jgi:hypothetical protein
MPRSPKNGSEPREQGVRRVQAYARSFNPFTASGGTITPNLMLASTDTEGSEQPRLTLEPLARYLGLPLDAQFTEHQEKELAAYLSTSPLGKVVLIAWHHHKLAKLHRAAGWDPVELQDPLGFA